MASSAVLGYSGAAAANDVVVGALITSFAIIAMSEATRGVRWINFPLGLWLFIAPFALGFEPKAGVNSLLVGLLVCYCATPKGKVKNQFAGGWSALLK